MVLLSFCQSSTEMGGSFGVYDENPEALNGMPSAFLATLLWGGSTVAGKAAVMRYPNSVVLFWRWAIAFVFLSGVVVVRQVPMPWERIFTSEIFLPLLYLGVIAQTT